MLLLTSLLFGATIFNSLIGYNDCTILPNGNAKSQDVFTINNINVYIQVDDENEDLKKLVPATTAVLTEPSSRSYNCFLETNRDCDIFKSDDNSGMIIGPVDISGLQDGKIASAGNPSYAILDQHAPGRWNRSHMKVRKHNSTHLATKIAWTLNDPAVVVDSVKVFLSSGVYTEDQSIKKSLLNLVCSYEGDSQASMHHYVLRFDCYIHNEFVKDLLYKAGDSGVLVSSLKIAGANYAFYQVADVSLNEPVKQIVNYHGYVSEPLSRAKLCQMRVNKNCGFIMYEPQSVEGFKGFPDEDYSPPDGKIASANIPKFDQLNEYGPNRWVQVKFPEVRCHNKTHVSFDLTWMFTAVHSSENIHIYVSNGNYNLNEPLARRHLDLNPICTMELGGKRPPSQLTLSCPISLEKYRELSERKELLLLSVWNIYDTPFAFYQVADIQGLSGEQSYENVSRKCQ